MPWTVLRLLLAGELNILVGGRIDRIGCSRSATN